MNNEQLKQLRQKLRMSVNKKYDQIEEPESTLDLLQVSQDAGEAHEARRLLEMMPEPEHDAVIQYRSVVRAIDEVDHAEAEYKLRDRATELREKSLELIRKRIEVKESDGTQLILEDPISKMKCQYGHAGGVDVETDFVVEQFVEDILLMGADGQ